MKINDEFDLTPEVIATLIILGRYSSCNSNWLRETTYRYFVEENDFAEVVSKHGDTCEMKITPKGQELLVAINTKLMFLRAMGAVDDLSPYTSFQELSEAFFNLEKE